MYNTYEVSDQLSDVPLQKTLSSTKNVTVEILLLSVTVAHNLMTQEYEADQVGKLRVTTGGMLSDNMLFIFTDIGAEVVRFQDVSLARADMTCTPFDTGIVFQLNE
jgi:hypothetical protein